LELDHAIYRLYGIIFTSLVLLHGRCQRVELLLGQTTVAGSNFLHAAVHIKVAANLPIVESLQPEFALQEGSKTSRFKSRRHPREQPAWESVSSSPPPQRAKTTDFFARAARELGKVRARANDVNKYEDFEQAVYLLRDSQRCEGCESSPKSIMLVEAHVEWKALHVKIAVGKICSHCLFSFSRLAPALGKVGR
jgi:hypothetical protein